MKRINYIFAILCAGAAVMASCSKPEADEPEEEKKPEEELVKKLAASADLLDEFEVKGSSAATLKITAENVEWTSNAPEWVLVAPKSGKASADVKVSVLDNFKDEETATEPRKGEIVFSADGVESVKVAVSQKGFTPVPVAKVEVTDVNVLTVTKGDVVTISGSGFGDDPNNLKVTADGKDAVVKSCADASVTVEIPELKDGQIFKIKIALGKAEATTPDMKYFFFGKVTTSFVFGDGTNTAKEGVGLEAGINSPEYIGFAPDGSLWLSGRGGTAHNIYKCDLASGQVKIVAAAGTDISEKFYPWGGDFNSKGEFSICGKPVFKIGTIDNSGKWTENAIEGIPTANESFMNCVYDKSDVLYIADRGNNKTPRIIVTKGYVYQTEYALPGCPYNIQLDPEEKNFYVGTSNKYVIYSLPKAGGEAVVVAGVGTKPAAATLKDGPAKEATIGVVSGIYIDPATKYMYFNDLTSRVVRVLVPGPDGDYAKGAVKTIAGKPFNSVANGKGTVGDGETETQFSATLGQITGKDGVLYVADCSGFRVVKVEIAK